ncbi:MAG: ornithine carbamoyltransferase [Ostreibacterium sp.]
MNNPFYRKSFLKLIDFSKDDIQLLLNIASKLKQQKNSANREQYLLGKNIALIFEKNSTRTRVAFEVAAYDQGANVTYLASSSSQMGEKESIKDSARVLGRFYDAIQYRGFAQEKVETLAQYSGVPVYNGLTDTFHPTQVLADLLTMSEQSDKPLSEISYCFVGDCRFNMGNSLLLAGALMGMDVRLLCPDNLRPNNNIIAKAAQLAKQSGASITLTTDQDKALNGCEFVHTDIWVSMGETESTWVERIKLLRDYRVNKTLMTKTHHPNAKFMHCLPALHNRETSVGEKIYQQFGLDGIEVSESVFESEASIVFEQAENRLHTIKAIMVASLVKELAFIV